MSYQLPTQTPFSYNIGMGFATNCTDWYIKILDTGNRNKLVEYSQNRLEQVVKTFKLIRIYAFLTPGWEQTGTLDPVAEALVNVMKADSSVEAAIGTSNSVSWFLKPDNVVKWVSILNAQLGDAVSQVKTILIGNEVNANGFTAADLTTIQANFKAALGSQYIPVTVSFNNLPVQSGNTTLDNMVKAIVDGWDNAHWNGGNQFVFIDPYPDASGINNGAGVFTWQKKVYDYYHAKHPNLQIFIGETGAEGYSTDKTSIPVINEVFTALEGQYDTNHQTVPTFMLEAVDEPHKPATPDQRNMGLYADTQDAGTSIALKTGVHLPSWM